MIIETLFASSFVGIAIMLSTKLAEARFGEFHWWSKMVSWGDKKVHELVDRIIQKYSLWKKIATVFVFEFVPAFAYRKAVELKDYLYKKYYSSAHNLRGEKRMLRSNGTVSEFLQSIKKEEAVIAAETSVEGELK